MHNRWLGILAIDFSRGEQSRRYGNGGQKQPDSYPTCAHFHGVNSFPMWDYLVIVYCRRPFGIEYLSNFEFPKL
jgi:hypothetical protein